MQSEEKKGEWKQKGGRTEWSGGSKEKEESFHLQCKKRNGHFRYNGGIPCAILTKLRLNFESGI